MARQLFFTADTPELTITRTVARLQNESALAVAQSRAPIRHKPSPTDAPVLVVGAEHDAMVSIDDVRATADFYNTRSNVIPGSGHCIMLDTYWEQAASLIASWLQSLDLNHI